MIFISPTPFLPALGFWISGDVKSSFNTTNFLGRKKYVKNCQIRHSYGGENDDDVNEAQAILVTQTAIADGTAQPAPHLEAVAAPEGAEVDVGGKACKWCGSKTHLRRSHNDCPANTRNT